MKQTISSIFAESVAAKQQFLQESSEALTTVIVEIVRSLKGGGKLLIFGNGGSAADAQHIAAEFVNRYLIERPPLPAIALTTDTSTLTSILNDYGAEVIFAKQIQALGRKGDVAIAISTSGNSDNILHGIEACRKIGIRTIGFTGGTGGAMAERVDHLLCVSATRSTPRIQEVHILIGHTICELVDQELFGNTRSQS